MAYRYLEDIALADIAFEAEGSSQEELFVEAAKAVTDSMVDSAGLRADTESSIELSAPTMERLLFDWLAEIVFLKESEQLFFRDFKVTIKKREFPREHFEIQATARGERLDADRHDLRNDVKAVTMHKFELEELPGKFRARVVLDI